MFAASVNARAAARSLVFGAGGFSNRSRTRKLSLRLAGGLNADAGDLAFDA
jgi:hypothetical protein